MTDIEHPQKRAYHSPARERQAEESRQRILQAARVHFLERGYSGTTIDAIAKEADFTQDGYRYLWYEARDNGRNAAAICLWRA